MDHLVWYGIFLHNSTKEGDNLHNLQFNVIIIFVQTISVLRYEHWSNHEAFNEARGARDSWSVGRNRGNRMRRRREAGRRQHLCDRDNGAF